MPLFKILEWHYPLTVSIHRSGRVRIWRANRPASARAGCARSPPDSSRRPTSWRLVRAWHERLRRSHCRARRLPVPVARSRRPANEAARATQSIARCDTRGSVRPPLPPPPPTTTRACPVRPPRDMSSQICLKWNSFLSNIATSFESLWEEEGLVDVTLASDGQCLTAHKVILSASSPFFKKVFQVRSRPLTPPLPRASCCHPSCPRARLTVAALGAVEVRGRLRGPLGLRALFTFRPSVPQRRRKRL